MPDDRSDNRGLKQRDLDVMTLQLAWADSLSHYECPPERFLRGFLNRGPVSTVMGVFEIAQRRKFENAEHAGAWVMHELSHRQNGNQPVDNSRGVHYDSDGKKVTTAALID
jgi:hypothetical protein